MKAMELLSKTCIFREKYCLVKPMVWDTHYLPLDPVSSAAGRDPDGSYTKLFQTITVSQKLSVGTSVMLCRNVIVLGEAYELINKSICRWFMAHGSRLMARVPARLGCTDRPIPPHGGAPSHEPLTIENR